MIDEQSREIDLRDRHIAALEAENAKLRTALEKLYNHTKNNYQICGLNHIAKEALGIWEPAWKAEELKFADNGLLAYYIKTDSDGLREKAKERWREIWCLDYPYWTTAASIVMNFETGGRKEDEIQS
jgi:hypothetical protein